MFVAARLPFGHPGARGNKGGGGVGLYVCVCVCMFPDLLLEYLRS